MNLWRNKLNCFGQPKVRHTHEVSDEYGHSRIIFELIESWKNGKMNHSSCALALSSTEQLIRFRIALPNGQKQIQFENPFLLLRVRASVCVLILSAQSMRYFCIWIYHVHGNHVITYWRFMRMFAHSFTFRWHYFAYDRSIFFVALLFLLLCYSSFEHLFIAWIASITCSPSHTIHFTPDVIDSEHS